MPNWATMTVTHNETRRHSMDVQAESVYNAAHIFVSSAKKSQQTAMLPGRVPLPNVATVFEVVYASKIHRVEGKKLQNWIVSQREVPQFDASRAAEWNLQCISAARFWASRCASGQRGRSRPAKAANGRPRYIRRNEHGAIQRRIGPSEADDHCALAAASGKESLSEPVP